MKLIVGLVILGPNTRRPGTTSARWSSTSWSPRRVRRWKVHKIRCAGRHRPPRRGTGPDRPAHHLHEHLGSAGRPAGQVLFRGARRSDRRTRRARYRLRSRPALNAVAVKADTTACGRSARCSGTAITCGSAWASAGLRGGRIRLTSCSNRFPPRQRPTSDSHRKRRGSAEILVRQGLEPAQNIVHAWVKPAIGSRANRRCRPPGLGIMYR